MSMRMEGDSGSDFVSRIIYTGQQKVLDQQLGDQ